MANFGAFEDAILAFEKGDYAGVGFALGPDGTGRFWQGGDVHGHGNGDDGFALRFGDV